MFLPEGMFLPFNFFIGILDIRIDDILILIFKFQPLHSQQGNFFLFEFFQFIPNISINKVSYILTVVYLRYGIVFPFFRDDVVFLERDVEYSSASVLFLEFTDVGSFDLHGTVDCDGWAFDVVAFLGLSDVDTIEVLFL